MFYVYILRSLKDKNKFYVGLTNNLERRLKEHVNPKSGSYTRKYTPWRIETYVVFENEELAKDFEIYLKSHSGRAFLRRRLLPAE